MTLKRTISKRLWLFLAIVSGAFLSALLTADGQAASASRFPNLEIVILLDESNSMRDTDPQIWRNDAVEKFIGSLGIELSGADFRLSVVTFSDDALSVSGNDGFVSLKEDEAREGLRSAFLGRPWQYQWTDVLAALQQAKQIFENREPDYKPIIVLITDGQPETAFANRRSYGTAAANAAFPGYLNDVKTFATTQFQNVTYGDAGSPCSITRGIPIYTVALRVADAATEIAYSESDKQLWKEIANLTGGTYYEILAQNDAEFLRRLVTVFGDMQRQMLCASVVEGSFQPIAAEGSVIESFEISSINDSFLLDITKTDSDVQITIRNAEEIVVGRTQDNTHLSYEAERAISSSGLQESWSYKRPENLSGWDGNWTVEFINGTGDITVTPEVKYAVMLSSDVIAADLVQPASRFLPLGGLLAMQQQVTAANELPVVETAEFSIRCSDNKTYTLSKVPEISGPIIKYLLDLTEAVPSQCQIVTQLTIQTNDGAVTIPYKYDVILENYPRIDIVSPVAETEYAMGELPNLEVTAFVGEVPYPAASGKDKVLATITDVSTGVAVHSEIELPNVDNIFTSSLPSTPALDPGAYCALFEFQAFPTGGADYLPSYFSETCFTVSDKFVIPPPPTVILTDSPPPSLTPPCNGPDCAPEPLPLSSLCLPAILLFALVLLPISLIRSRAVGRLVDLRNPRSGNNPYIRRSIIPFVKPRIHIYDEVGRPQADFSISIRPGNRVQLKLNNIKGGSVRFRGQVINRGMDINLVHDDQLQVGNVQLKYQQVSQPRQAAR